MGRRRASKTRITRHEEEVLYGPRRAQPQLGGHTAAGVVQRGGGIVEGITAHNFLFGKQGGSGLDEYYHLDASDFGDLTDANAQLSALHTDGSPTFADVVADSISLDNTGLHILDSNASHDLIIKPGSDLAADRILTLTTGDAARTVTLSGNPTLDDWFDQPVKAASTPTFDGVVLEGGTHDTTLDAGTPTEAVTYTLPAADASDSGKVLSSNASGALSWIAAGDIYGIGVSAVSGPGSSTDHAVARWDGAGGDTLQDSSAILLDDGTLSGLATVTVGAGASGEGVVLEHDSGDIEMYGTLGGVGSPRLDFYHLSPSPADGDRVMSIRGFGYNVTGNSPETIQYGMLQLRSADVTDGTEDGEFRLFLTKATDDTAVALLVKSTGEINTYGDIIPDAAGGTDLGSTSKELGDVYVATDKKVYYGNGQEAYTQWESAAGALRIIVT